MRHDQARELMTDVLEQLRREELLYEHPDRLKDLTTAQITGPRGSGLLSLREELAGREVVSRVHWTAPLIEHPSPSAAAAAAPRDVPLEPPVERAAEAILSIVR
jgi:hypothetical protein